MTIRLIPAPLDAPAAPHGRRGIVLDEDTGSTAGPGREASARWLRTTLGAAHGPAAGADTGGGEPHPAADRLRPRRRLGSPEAYRLVRRRRTASSSTGRRRGRASSGAPRRCVSCSAPTRSAARPVRPGATGRSARGPIEDAPRFRWRGLMLDVARHFMPKDGVLRYLDLMAAHKLNVLHFHLTDDQGWRVEIKRYPRLTEVGSWRARTKFGHRASPLWEEKPHGGFYTQDDIREIVAYAAERHITVVPEIDVPGHSQAAIAAYPELGNTDVIDTDLPHRLGQLGHHPERTRPHRQHPALLRGRLRGTAGPVPLRVRSSTSAATSAPRTSGGQSPTAQARIAELGLADEDELQSWFIRHFDNWLSARGRRLIGWDEILEGGLAPGRRRLVLARLRGRHRGRRARATTSSCAPSSTCTWTTGRTAGADEPVPIALRPHPGGRLPLRAGSAGVDRGGGRGTSSGTQANVWTEVMEDQRARGLPGVPAAGGLRRGRLVRLPAPAERDFADFERRMAAHYARLDALGVGYRPPGGPLPWQRRPGVLGRPIEGAPPNV